jgi:hypothetical protein
VESLRHREAIRQSQKALVFLALLGIALLAFPATAIADLRDTTSNAHSNRNGVDFSVREVTKNFVLSGSRSAGVQCTYQPQFGNIGLTSGYWKRAPSKTSVLGHRTCSDGTNDFVWVDACAFVSLPMCPASTDRADPAVLAREVRDRLPVPRLLISSNPERGLVGLKSWFWLETGGNPLSDSLSRFGERVDVVARPQTYQWDFGDGHKKITTSPGQPYPRRSPVTHIYQRSSAGYTKGYTVSVTTIFEVRWRTNGGEWRVLPGISRTSERFYRVAESQTVNEGG